MQTLPLDIKLQTKRLTIRRLVETDVDAIVAAATAPNAELEKWVYQANIYQNPVAVQALIAECTIGLIQNQQVILGGFDTETGDFCLYFEIANLKHGRLGTWQLGFWAHPQARGKGYVTESLQSLITFLFTRLTPQPQRVEFDCAPENAASNKLAKKCGFMPEGTHHNAYTNAHGEVQHLNMYAHTPQTFTAWVEEQKQK